MPFLRTKNQNDDQTECSQSVNDRSRSINVYKYIVSFVEKKLSPSTYSAPHIFHIYSNQ